jgi:predicted  nucleic acid-binding Zn-ribbon protein
MSGPDQVFLETVRAEMARLADRLEASEIRLDALALRMAWLERRMETLEKRIVIG